MHVSAAESPLDRVDAYLEALWDSLQDGVGDDLGALPDWGVPDPADQGPDRGGEALLSWVLGRLRGLSPEPKEDFRRQVGTLLEDFRRRRSPWNAAALRLLGDPYTFVATGPRRHEDWAHDVLAVMHRAVADPRGWIRLDGDRTNTARHTVAAYPFDPPAASEVLHRLYPLEVEAAVCALAVMSEEWQYEPAPVRSRPDRDAILADARTLLDRYGPTARYWTNALSAAYGPAPDFLATGLPGHGSHSFLTRAYVNGIDLLDDLGLIAVNRNEVGVFWAIGAS
ncbi:hypothetical protein [Streptomyces sp. NPDC049585]|uniref:hypothetical protein n=1 Tax=Streptomyces sp. NPDC049585 TaxID=3155154 RepID=UPI0034413FB7